MATTINKQKIVDKVFAALGKQARDGEATARPVLEQFIFAVCREGTTREAAEQIFRNLQDRFFDWNEVRVSNAHEVAEAMDGLAPDAEARGQRIIDLLQEVFDTTFSFDLERLQKEGVKVAAKRLARFQAANDYTVSFVVQHSLGGHAMPLDEPSLRVLRRLGLLEEGSDMEALRSSMEHQVPKAKGSLFVDLISIVADGHCFAETPTCTGCPMSNCCPSAVFTKAPAVAASKKPR
jgi:endonuclease III